MVVDKFNNEIGYMTIDIDGMLSDYENEMNGFKYLFRVSEATDEDYKKVMGNGKTYGHPISNLFFSRLYIQDINYQELHPQGKDIIVLKSKI
jgi:hypothetical protein